MAVIGAGSSIGGLTGSGAISRLLVVVSGETSGLNRALTGATKGLEGFNAKANAVGSALTRSLTLPILALGGVALKLASDYASAIGRVQGLTTVLDDGKHSIQQVSDSILSLSQIVPTAPTELADAMYFAGSAGLNFSDAMKVVTLSAKGAAIGMGDAKDIAKILIYALNAFKGTGLTAAHAMDVLTAAIKYGTAEPDEMAIALGRLLPIAREAGLTFDDVAASVAALTNIGMPTRVATTSLRALFTELLSPTKAATEALKQFGLSAQDVRDVMRAGGPIAVLKLLEEATHGNEDAIHDIIPQIRGLTAYFGLAGDKLKDTKRIIDGVHHSVGTLDKAFGIISKTPRFQFEIGLNKLRVAGIKMGNALIPIFVSLMHKVGDFGDFIANDIPDGMKQVIVGAGLVLASLGPLMKIWGTLSQIGTGLAASMKGITTGFTIAAIAAGIAVGSFNSLTKGSDGLSASFGTLAGTAIAVGLALKGVQLLAASGLITKALSAMASVAPGAAFGLMRFSIALSGLSAGTIGAIALGIGVLALAIGHIIGESHAYQTAVKGLTTDLMNAAVQTQTLAATIDSLANRGAAETLLQLGKALHVLNKPVGLALPKTLDLAREHVALLRKQFDRLIASWDTVMAPGEMEAINKALGMIARGVKTPTEAFKSMGLNIQDFLDADVHEAERAGTATEGLSDRFRNLFEVIDAGTLTNEKYKQSVLDTLAGVQLNDAAVQKLADHFGVSKDVINKALSDLGQTGLGIVTAGGKAIDAFGNAAFGGFGKAAAKAKVAQAAIDSLNKTLKDTLSGNLGLFDAFDKKIKQTTDQIVAHAQRASNLALQQTEDAQKLIARGVPADLVNELISQGPQMVAKFAGATDKQLAKLVLAYQIRLGAIDAAILREGDHQKKKGKGMVDGFVQSILSSEGLTRQAGWQIVNSVAKGLQSGSLKPESLHLILNVVRTIEASGLPKQAGSQVAAHVAQGMASGKIKASGAKFIADFAHGIGQSGLPKAAAAKVVNAAVTQVEASGGLAPAGKKAGQQFANGLVSKSGVAGTNAKIVRDAATKALGNGQVARPKGQNFGDQYASGIQSKKDKAAASAGQLVASAVAHMFDGMGSAGAAGAGAGASYAAGLASQTSSAYAAGYAVGAAGKAGMVAGSKGSPRYFSYYLGQDIVKDFGEGLKKGNQRLGPHRLNITSGSRNRSRDQQGRLVILQGNIMVDGMESRMRIVAREEANGELAYRGL